MKAVVCHVQRRASDPAVVTLRVELRQVDRDQLEQMLAAAGGRLQIMIRRAEEPVTRRPW